MDNNKLCKICNSPNTNINKYLTNFYTCSYCCFSEIIEKQDCSEGSKYELNNEFIQSCVNKKGIKNLAVCSSDPFYKNIYERSFFSEVDNVENSFNIKNASSILKYGKIDLLIIPDISEINLWELVSTTKDTLSDNVDMHIGIYNPFFIQKNYSKYFTNNKYLYSMFVVSRILSVNNFDIYNLEEKDGYILLNAKRGVLETQSDINKKIQTIWNDHYDCDIFHTYPSLPQKALHEK